MFLDNQPDEKSRFPSEKNIYFEKLPNDSGMRVCIDFAWYEQGFQFLDLLRTLCEKVNKMSDFLDEVQKEENNNHCNK